MTYTIQVIVIWSRQCPARSRRRLLLPGEPRQMEVAETTARARRGQQLDEFRGWFDAHPPEMWENFVG